MGIFTTVALLDDNTITTFQEVGGYIGGLSRHTIGGIVNIGFEFTVLQFPKIICRNEK